MRLRQDAKASRESDKILLSVKGLRHVYQGGASIFPTELSFSICKGETVGLMGSSGCGKSTLLKCISGLTNPTQGQITSVIQSTDRRSNPIQMVFQNARASLNPMHSVRFCLNEALSCGPINKPKLSLTKLMKLMNLDLCLIDKLPHQLSGGEAQRVSIARCFATEPALALLDEPFSSLDPMTTVGLLDNVHMLSKMTHSSILMVSHDEDVLRYLCDRVISINA